MPAPDTTPQENLQITGSEAILDRYEPDSSTPVGAEYGTIRSSRFFVVSARTRRVRCAGSRSSVRSEHNSSRRNAAS
jgi:hypothetical protein